MYFVGGGGRRGAWRGSKEPEPESGAGRQHHEIGPAIVNRLALPYYLCFSRNVFIDI